MKIRKTPAASRNSRRYARHQHLSELSLTYEGRGETLFIHPPNISTRGMFINTSVVFPESSVLKLYFRLARTGACITARCEVRYCLPGVGVGVEFVNLPLDCVKAIEIELSADRNSAAANSREAHMLSS